jgi:hypothetical protein
VVGLFLPPQPTPVAETRHDVLLAVAPV